MATVVFVHAHPDDESTLTSGSMARASKEGHRVVTVIATGGEHGASPPDLAPGETLADRRRLEAERCASELGVHRLEWLGYTDSGMTGWEQNNDEEALSGADLDEAAGRLAAILDEEAADVVVGYDFHGNYGHPDHIKVHHVVRRAVELTGHASPRLLEATMNRDRLRYWTDMARAAGMTLAFDPDAPFDDGNPMGMPQAEIHWEVDVTAYLDQRWASVKAYASQAKDLAWVLQMSAEDFARAYGFEYYIEPARPDGMRTGWFLDG